MRRRGHNSSLNLKLEHYYALPPGPCAAVERIDAVFFWINTSDDAWADRARKACPDSPVGENRARDADPFQTLRFSMRSLLENAPWIGDLHIVTDQQVPSWLDVDNNRVHMVDHAMVTTDRRSVYRASILEAHLGELPATVSECFLYLNDDFLILEPTERAFFFPNGYPRAFYSGLDSLQHHGVRDQTGKVHYAPHSPSPVCKRLFQDWCSSSEHCPEIKRGTCSDPWDPEGISAFVDQWTQVGGQAVPQNRTGRTSCRGVLGLGSWYTPTFLFKFERKRCRPTFSHVVSGQAAESRDFCFISSFLQVEFPDPAPWEIGG